MRQQLATDEGIDIRAVVLRRDGKALLDTDLMTDRFFQNDHAFSHP